VGIRFKEGKTNGKGGPFRMPLQTFFHHRLKWGARVRHVKKKQKPKDAMRTHDMKPIGPDSREGGDR